MRRENRLVSEADFRRVRAQGRSWAHPLVVLHAARASSPCFRLGISSGKRVGSAVVRNRVRRRISEIVRARLGQLSPGWDAVLAPRPSAAEASGAELAAAVEELLRRASLLPRTTDPAH